MDQDVERDEQVDPTSSDLTPDPSLVSIEFEEEESTTVLGLRLHNEKRTLHDVPPMTLNRELCSLAEDYARAHIKGTKIKLDDTRMGHSIFKMDHFSEDGMNTDVDAVKGAVITFYESQSKYNWGDPMTSSEESRPFQEIVWKGCTCFGVGAVIGKEGIFVVALYRRARETTSDEILKENVLPLKE